MHRKSTTRPFTSAIHTSGFFSAKLGSIHRGSSGRVPSVSSITRAFAWTVLSPTSNAAHKSAVDMYGVNRFVAEKIDPPKNVNDTACPRARLPGSERAQALPVEHLGH